MTEPSTGPQQLATLDAVRAEVATIIQAEMRPLVAQICEVLNDVGEKQIAASEALRDVSRALSIAAAVLEAQHTAVTVH